MQAMLIKNVVDKSDTKEIHVDQSRTALIDLWMRQPENQLNAHRQK